MKLITFLLIHFKQFFFYEDFFSSKCFFGFQWNLSPKVADTGEDDTELPPSREKKTALETDPT